MIAQLLRRAARKERLGVRYSLLGQAFHWTMAALILFQLWWGWRMADLPVGYGKLDAYQTHARVGLAILCLALLRMTWRLFAPGPNNDADKPGWQSTAAHLTHFAFYGLFLALPLSGWLMLSATGKSLPFTLVAGVDWPNLPVGDLSRRDRWRLEDWAGEAHVLMVWGLAGLVLMHVGAALKHHFVDHDNVLEGMLPPLTEEARREEAEAEDRQESDGARAPSLEPQGG